MNIRQEVQTRLIDQPLYSQENQTDPMVKCKLFHAFGSGTWYLTEYDGKNMAFGYVTGFTADEWGYVTISELEALTIGRSTPRIECDLHFESISFSKIRCPRKVIS
jgi:Protein of unknown function (DUF2958)